MGGTGVLVKVFVLAGVLGESVRRRNRCDRSSVKVLVKVFVGGTGVFVKVMVGVLVKVFVGGTGVLVVKVFVVGYVRSV